MLVRMKLKVFNDVLEHKRFKMFVFIIDNEKY